MCVNLALGPLSMISLIKFHNYLLTIPGIHPLNQDLGQRQRQVTSAGKQIALAGAPETRVDQKATKNGV